MAKRKTERRRGLRPRSIFRTEKKRGFVRIDNATLQDNRLSFLARGILANLLSRPNDWEITQAALELAGKEGRDAISGAMRELQSLGYARKELVRKSGKLQGWRWMIAESPNHGFPALGAASTERPISDSRETDSRETDGRKTAPTKNRVTNDQVTNHQRQTTSPQPPVEEPKAPRASSVPPEGGGGGLDQVGGFARIIEAHPAGRVEDSEALNAYRSNREELDAIPDVDVAVVKEWMGVDQAVYDLARFGPQLGNPVSFVERFVGQIARAKKWKAAQKKPASPEIAKSLNRKKTPPGIGEQWRDFYAAVNSGHRPTCQWSSLDESERIELWNQWENPTWPEAVEFMARRNAQLKAA